MRLWNRRKPQPATEPVDPFPGDALTQRMVIAERLGLYADQLERIIAGYVEQETTRLFMAGMVHGLRDTAQMVRGDLFDLGTAWPITDRLGHTETRHTTNNNPTEGTNQ